MAFAFSGGWFQTNNFAITVFTICGASIFLLLIYRYVLCLARDNVTANSEADQSIESLEADPQGQVQSQERPYNALDPFIIATLPVYVYKQIDQPNNDGTRDCAVCLSSFENEEIAMLLPNCKHMFHEQCINMWFSSHSTCPICRRRVEARLVPEPKEKSVGWLPFMGVDMDFFHPVTPSSEGISDGSAQGSEVEGLDSRLNSFERLVEAEWRQIRDGSSSWQ
ncbi:RING-H2 finger protein ATL40-like [Telopea speciosissima]|uniref:RING-H2 finger protein ATL40-like n=1 Tax=Telopea speciosissima TaxID=54955 RepID=UPI001CC3A629|nr:RING-H2 finger protein ATL40-like [Telopea speciosissima]